MVITRDLRLADGRDLRIHDTVDGDLTLVWHHGTPQTGLLYEPLLGLARERGMRLVSCARPGYGGSTRRAGRARRAGGRRHRTGDAVARRPGRGGGTRSARAGRAGQGGAPIPRHAANRWTTAVGTVVPPRRRAHLRARGLPPGDGLAPA